MSNPTSSKKSELMPNSISGYWTNVRNRHYEAERPSFDTINTNTPEPDINFKLPKDAWRVVSLHLSNDRESIFVICLQNNMDHPTIFRLILDRQYSRGEDDPFGFDEAKERLDEIISANNRTTKQSKDIKDKKDRKEWWDERCRLDELMPTELLSEIEQRWLGGFRVCLIIVRVC